MIVTVWILFAFAITSVILRFVSRAPYFGGNLGWDDWTILMLLGLQLPLNITGIFLVHYGLGQDIWMLEEYEIVTVFKVCTPRPQVKFVFAIITHKTHLQWYFAGEIIYLLAMTLLKVSVLLQYLRIFNFRIWVYILMGISVSYGASFIIATLAGCRPFTYNFHRWQAEYSGTCIDITREIYASAVINIILDGIITLLPTTQMQVSPSILLSGRLNVLISECSFHLQMNKKKKLVISFIFLAGFAVTGISIARFIVFDRASETNFTCEPLSSTASMEGLDG